MLSNISNISISQVISELVEIPCRVVLLFVLWNHFVPLFSCENKKRSNAYILFMIVMFAEIIRWCFLTDGFPFWIISICGILFIYALFYKRESIPETVFTLILFVNLKYLSFFIVNSIVNSVSNRMMDEFQRSANMNAVAPSRVGILFLLSEGIYILVLFMEILPLILFVKKPEKMKWAEICYLSVLNVVGIILTRIMMGISVLDTANGAIVLLDEKPHLLWLLPLVSILFYFGELSAIIIWQRYCAYRQKSEKYFVRCMEEEAIRRRLNDTERYYEQVRKVRHEMANHLTNIRGLAQRGLNEDLCRYITDIDDTIRSVEMRYVTGNPITDVVVNDRSRKAEEDGIAFSISFAYDETWGISVYDLSIILSNVLDNALKAAKSALDERRYINMKTVDKENVILIVCENGFERSADISKDMNDMWHGIGLKNVEDIAERYNGTVNINREDFVYKISVLLKKCPSVT